MTSPNLSQLDDARWRAAVDADLLGEANEQQRALLESYTPRGAEHRAEAEFLSALSTSAYEADRKPADEAVDEALLAVTLDAFAQRTPGSQSSSAQSSSAQSSSAQSSSAQSSSAQSSSARGLWIAAAAVLLAVGGMSVWAVQRHDGPSVEVATLGFEQDWKTSTGVDDALAWHIESGIAEVVSEPSANALTESLPIDQPLRVEEELCASRPAHSVCLRRGSQVIARRWGALALVEGQATVRTEDTKRIPWVELGAGVRVEAAPHSVVVVERRAAGWAVTVDLGVATVVETKTRRDVQEGESLQRGLAEDQAEVVEVIEVIEAAEDFESERVTKGKRRSSKSSGKASTMLAQARAHRRDGDRDAAVATYERLIRKHPRSAAAHTANISVGQLELERGHATRALAAFRRYLARGGPLAEEAAFGEIRALRALGRSAQVRAAERAFVKRYPDSRHSAKLER